jgi:hypothetical protein
MAEFPLSHYGLPLANRDQWAKDMTLAVQNYLRGQPIYVSFDPEYEPKRQGSVGRLVIENMQDILHGSRHHTYYSRITRAVIEGKPENVRAENLLKIIPNGHVVWDGRKNKVQSQWKMSILPEHQGGTVWVYETPKSAQVQALDRLGREIKVGDFISYILYHFDNGRNGAGIYYGKVTKIDLDGTVHAKNIKLKDDDQVAEKKVKDNSLVVIMSKDLMDKLMLARLSII